MTSTQTRTDGRHDFDFQSGRWTVHNQKLASLAEPGCTEWVEFSSVIEAHPVLGGLGNMDTFSTDEMPGRGSFEGVTLRLFNPETGLWRIWWASTTMPGHLDPTPTEGRFVDGHGVFECDDVLNGRPIKVRYDWTPGQSTTRWEQSFSYDEGQTWEKNWIMSSTRA